MTNQSPPAVKKRLPRICLVLYLLGAVSALLYLLFTVSPAFADWFNGTVSPIGRRILAWITLPLPFSFAELLIILAPLLAILLISIGAKHFCDSNRSMFVYLGILFSAVATVGIIFVWNFAAGYYGTTLDQKLGMERKKSSAQDLYITAEKLRAEMEALEEEILFLEDGSSLMPYSHTEMNDKILAAYDRFAERYDFIDTFYSRVKPVMLSEPMSYTHITGVYTFFTGEANINVNFPDYTIPYTAAHELAHQRGVAREDEANFVAFLVCMESDDPYLRYSACLNVYEYVISALSRADSKLYRDTYLSLPMSIRDEEDAYRKFFEKYRDNTVADISQSVNNSYLQSQGTPGTRSYNMVVDLAVAYYKNR